MLSLLHLRRCSFNRETVYIPGKTHNNLTYLINQTLTCFNKFLRLLTDPSNEEGGYPDGLFKQFVNFIEVAEDAGTTVPKYILIPLDTA